MRLGKEGKRQAIEIVTYSSSTSLGCSRAIFRDWKDWLPTLHRATYLHRNAWKKGHNNSRSTTEITVESSIYSHAICHIYRHSLTSIEGGDMR